MARCKYLYYNRHRYCDPNIGRFVSKDLIRYAGGLNFYSYAPNPIQWVDPLGLARVKGITPNKKGTRTDIGGDKLPDPGVGLSTTAGGGGAHHHVVAELYEDHKEPRSIYHGQCGEADALSNIAKKHNVQTVDELKDLMEGSTSTTTKNDGKMMPFCPSCSGVMSRLKVKDGAV